MNNVFRIMLVMSLGLSWLSVASEISAVEAKSLLKLGQMKEQQGQFTQRKYFKRLAKPFVSSGEYHIDAQGLRWQTLTPAKSAIVITEDTMLLENGSGQQTQLNQGEMYARLLKQLMLGEFEALSPYFSMKTTAQSHCIVLLPTDESISQLMSEVKLCGQGQLDSLVLLDKQQNKTEITLH